MEDQEFVYVTRFLKPGMKPGERLVFGTVGSNSNLEVSGHPEYSSDYTFLLSD
jgi:hypothetical protein